MDYFARLLVYSSAEIRESILEIFAILTDKSERVKGFCLGNFKFMDRLFAILSYGYGNCEKQAQLACFILNNIAQLGTPEALQVFQKYERTLLLVSVNDENLSPITSSLLFTLSGRSDMEEERKENVAITNMRMNIRNEMEEESNSSQNNSSDE